MTPEEKLQVYLSASSAYDAQVIPGTHRVTFMSKQTGLPQVWTLNQAGKPVLFSSFSDRVMRVYHAPQGDKTVFGVDHQGNEKQQLYLLDASGDMAAPLVVSPEHFHHFGGFSPTGEQIVFSSNRRHPGCFDIFVQTIATGKVVTVYTCDGVCEPLKWLRDGKHLLISLQMTNLNNAVYSLNIESGDTTPLGPTDTAATYGSVVLTSDGLGGYLLTDWGEETRYIASFSLASSDQLTMVTRAEGWDIEELALAPDDQTLLFTVNEGGISRLHAFDLNTRQESSLNTLPDGVVNSLSWLNPTQCLLTLKTPVDPGNIWQVTLPDGKATTWTHFGETLTSVPTYEPRLCTFQSFDGLRVPYFYYASSAKDDKPVVVYVHGGPEGQTRADYNPIIQHLTDQGYAVAAPNVRGSSGYGRPYGHLDDGRKRMDAVKDLAWLVKDLVANHGVSADEIGIMGRSYGGFMVLAALTHYPDLWAAGVAIVGISHFRTFLENTGAWRRALRESEYGSLAEDSDFFESIAPLNHSDNIQAPLLMFHGRNDTRVPVTEAEQLASDMKERGQTVDLTIFEDEGHQTEKYDNHLTMHRETARFFATHLC